MKAIQIEWQILYLLMWLPLRFTNYHELQRFWIIGTHILKTFFIYRKVCWSLTYFAHLWVKNVCLKRIKQTITSTGQYQITSTEHSLSRQPNPLCLCYIWILRFLFTKLVSISIIRTRSVSISLKNMIWFKSNLEKKYVKIYSSEGIDKYDLVYTTKWEKDQNLVIFK